MEQDEQKALVKDLINVITAEIEDDFKYGKIPENWNGIELRWLIARKFSEVILKGIGTSYRKRKFNNYYLMENL